MMPMNGAWQAGQGWAPGPTRPWLMLILTGWLSVSSLPLAASATEVAASPAEASTAPVRHLILFIGDGRHLAHDIATSRYLFGHDEGLSYQRLPYRGQVATWDITT